MGLLNDVKKNEAAPVTEVKGAEGAKKKHNNSEYQKKARARALAAATLLDKTLTAEQKAAKGEGEFATVQDALNVLLKVRQPSQGAVAGQTPVFTKMFGESPKAGDKVGAYDMLKRTGKGFNDINKLIKKWAEQGTVVEFDEAKLEYTLKSIKA